MSVTPKDQKPLSILIGWIYCLLTDHEWEVRGDYAMCWRCKKLVHIGGKERV